MCKCPCTLFISSEILTLFIVDLFLCFEADRLVEIQKLNPGGGGGGTAK